MKLEKIIIAFIFSAAVPLSVLIYCDYNRYEIELSAASNLRYPPGYKIDKSTGKAWFIEGKKEYRVVP